MTDGIDQIALATGLIGGLAFFLFGMDIMTKALKQLAGDYLKVLLARVTRNRFAGLATGAAVTSVIQSSSITTVLVVGFISAGLMTLQQSVPVILGANIGTTITAQILAFKVTALAMPILALGFFVSFAAKHANIREYGRMILGLGLIFFGMSVMSDAVKPLRDFPPFLEFMVSLDNVLLAALVGAGFTAVVQSSSATTGILIVMAGQGLIGLEAAIALALGANIGTSVTAMLAGIGKPREAVRAAMVHTIFNVAGVLIWIGFVDHLAELARQISPIHPALEGLARTRAEVPRQIANVHTLFNLVNAAVFLGFTSQLARLVNWLVPDKVAELEPRFAPRHLDHELLELPSIALDAARREIILLGKLVQDMLTASEPTLISGSLLELDRLHVMDRPVDLLHREIIGYLRLISLEDLSEAQSGQLMALIKISNDLEHIGDQIATGLVTSARKRINERIVIGPKTVVVITRLHQKVLLALVEALKALEEQDVERAARVRAMKQDVTDTIEDISHHQLTRLRAQSVKRLPAYAREIELTEGLDDIFKTIRRISRTQLTSASKS